MKKRDYILAIALGVTAANIIMLAGQFRGNEEALGWQKR